MQFDLDTIGKMIARLIADDVTAYHERQARIAFEGEPARVRERYFSWKVPTLSRRQ